MKTLRLRAVNWHSRVFCLVRYRAQIEVGFSDYFFLWFIPTEVDELLQTLCPQILPRALLYQKPAE